MPLNSSVGRAQSCSSTRAVALARRLLEADRAEERLAAEAERRPLLASAPAVSRRRRRRSPGTVMRPLSSCMAATMRASTRIGLAAGPP